MTSRQIALVPDHLGDLIAGSFEIQELWDVDPGDLVFKCSTSSTSSTSTASTAIGG
jgi:hypothetical protein